MTHVVNPEEATPTLVVRASWHVLGNLEGVLEVPRAGVNDTEDNEVFGLNIVEV